jgi:hypothetical protein
MNNMTSGGLINTVYSPIASVQLHRARLFPLPYLNTIICKPPSHLAHVRFKLKWNFITIMVVNRCIATPNQLYTNRIGCVVGTISLQSASSSSSSCFCFPPPTPSFCLLFSQTKLLFLPPLPLHP